MRSHNAAQAARHASRVNVGSSRFNCSNDFAKVMFIAACPGVEPGYHSSADAKGPSRASQALGLGQASIGNAHSPESSSFLSTKFFPIDPPFTLEQ